MWEEPERWPDTRIGVFPLEGGRGRQLTTTLVVSYFIPKILLILSFNAFNYFKTVLAVIKPYLEISSCCFY